MASSDISSSCAATNPLHGKPTRNQRHFLQPCVEDLAKAGIGGRRAFRIGSWLGTVLLRRWLEDAPALASFDVADEPVFVFLEIHRQGTDKRLLGADAHHDELRARSKACEWLP